MKALIPIACGLVIGAFFVSTQKLTPEMAAVSSLAVVLFATPSYIMVVRVRGWKYGAAILAVLGIYALAVESLALASGIPYGDFTYTGLLASKVLDLTPWTVAFAYPPIILLACTVASKLTSRLPKSWMWWRILLLSALVATACDLILDPAAVYLRFWYWQDPGLYYGVPFINFVGWLLTSSIAAALFFALWQKRPSAIHIPIPASFGYSGLAIIWFWTAANAIMGQILPAIIGVFLTTFCWRILTSKQVQ